MAYFNLEDIQVREAAEYDPKAFLEKCEKGAILDEIQRVPSLLSYIQVTVNDYLLNGFYPRIYKDQLNPTKAYRNYFQTYVERDVRQLIKLKDLGAFQRLIKLCAGRIGFFFTHG